MKCSVLLLAFAGIMVLNSCYAEMPSENIETAYQESSESAIAETGKETIMKYDFSTFNNVTLTGTDFSELTEDEISVLYVQACYCQAMTDADTEVMREIVSEDMVFTHMSGMKQTRDEYFADIEDGSLKYFTIGIENPKISVNGQNAEITFTSVLNANAYGARGTYRMKGTHHYELRSGEWIAVNG